MRTLLFALIVTITVSSNVVLLTSNATSVRAVAPNNRTVVLDESANSKKSDFLGNGAKWIWIKGDKEWPSGYQVMFQGTITSDCPNASAQLKVAGQSIFAAYLNGDQIGYGTVKLEKYVFKVPLVCGDNSLKIVVTNYVGPSSDGKSFFVLDPLTGGHAGRWSSGSTLTTNPNILFSLTQDQTECYKCSNPLLTYNHKTCQCELTHHQDLHHATKALQKDRSLQLNNRNQQSISETQQSDDQ